MTTTFNTGNPVGSTASKDLSDNASNFDDANLFMSDTWQDRLGVTRDTVNGRIKSMGFAVPVTYASGIVFATNDNVKTVDEAGIIYAPLPSALPFTTTNFAADAAKFFVVQGLTNDQLINDILIPLEFVTVAAMKASTLAVPHGKRTGDVVRTLADGASGVFVWNSGDLSALVTSDPLGGVYAAPDSDATGASGAWVREWDFINAHPEWFGDVQDSVIAAINAVSVLGGNIHLNANKRYKPNDMTNPVLKANISIVGGAKPWFSTNCDRLEGGSIIEGRFTVSADNFSHIDVGYDNGEFVRSTYFPTYTGDSNDYPLGGGTWDAFALGQIDIASPVQRQCYRAENIIGLCIKSSTVGHALLQEAFSDGYMRNMHGMYSLHPFVIKGNVVRGGDLHGYGGGEEHFNLKADTYAACNDISLTSVTTDLQPEGTTPHSAPIVPAYGVYTFSATADVTNINLGTVKAWGAVQGVGESGGSVSNFIDGFHIENLNINGRNFAGSAGLMCSSDIKHYNYTFGTVKVTNVADAVAYKAPVTGGGYNNAAMRIGTLIVDSVSLRGINAISYGQIIVDNYITRGTVANKYSCDSTARLRIGDSRDEGSVTNRFYLDPITLSSGNWQQYASNAVFGIDLKNYGVVATGLLQQLSNVNAALCNLPVYLRPNAPTRIPLVISGSTGGIQTQFVTPAPADANLVINDGVNVPVADTDTWLSLDGVSWKFD